MSTADLLPLERVQIDYTRIDVVRGCGQRRRSAADRPPVVKACHRRSKSRCPRLFRIARGSICGLGGSDACLEIAIDHWAQAGGKWPLRRFIERSLRLLRRFAETESAPTGTRCQRSLPTGQQLSKCPSHFSLRNSAFFFQTSPL